ncbi:hypothetical protein HAX54_020501 [Datura stramonium]|uniref:DUF1985 domain-containing protein n=1 Tax=Datura stramonium TaxID=4076 RepID=A0ABS8USR6_DATST|nr:hypothetical protein [Datura stramonium]
MVEKSAPPKGMASRKGVKFDPLSVYEFTGDDLSPEGVVKISSDSKLHSTTKSVGKISTGRRTRSQAAHGRAGVGTTSNVKKSLKYPRAKGSVRGELAGKRKLQKDVNAAGKIMVNLTSLYIPYCSEEVVPEREDELCFKVNGTKLHFGLTELGIITGLRCCGDADKGYESSGTNRLMDMYFSDFEKVPKQSLIDCFLQKSWRSDEDAADFCIVESGDYETFPWGILVFRAILESINRLRVGLKMYRLGVYFGFQCWFYECCTNVGVLAHRLKFKNVSPTEFEQCHLDLPESSGNPNDNEVASRDLPKFIPSDDDLSTPPPKKSKNQPKTRSDPPVTNLERSGVKRLSDEQLELKSDIREVVKATELLKEQMMVSFADVFKAIESLSKKQSEKDNSEIDGRDGHHDRHGDGDSGAFNANDDHCSDGPDQQFDDDLTEGNKQVLEVAICRSQSGGVPGGIINLDAGNARLQACQPSGKIKGIKPPPGQCNPENDSDCCKQGKMYTTYKCSPPVTGNTKAVLTLNSFQKGGDGGGPSECDNQYHSDDTPVVALSTGWQEEIGALTISP